MNASNPGTGFLFDSVVAHNASAFPEPGGYLATNVKGVASSSAGGWGSSATSCHGSYAICSSSAAYG